MTFTIIEVLILLGLTNLLTYWVTYSAGWKTGHDEGFVAGIRKGRRDCERETQERIERDRRARLSGKAGDL